MNSPQDPGSTFRDTSFEMFQKYAVVRISRMNFGPFLLYRIKVGECIYELANDLFYIIIENKAMLEHFPT